MSKGKKGRKEEKEKKKKRKQKYVEFRAIFFSYVKLLFPWWETWKMVSFS